MMIRNRLAALVLAGAVALAGCSGEETQEEAQAEQSAGVQDPHAGLDMQGGMDAMSEAHASGVTTAEGVANPHARGPGRMPGEGGVTEINFRCADGQSFLFGLYTGSETARISIDGQTYELERVPSGSGMKYSDGTWSFFGKGPEALVMKDDEVVMKDCKAAGHP